MGISKLCVPFISNKSKKSTSSYELPPSTNEIEMALSNTLILDEILQNLPKKELLNCRLVNHTWNSVVLSILRKQNMVLTIDANNFQSYLYSLLKTSRKTMLASSSSPSTVVAKQIPAGAGGAINITSPDTLKLRVRIEKYIDQQEFDKISLGLGTFTRLLGSTSCIESLYIGKGWSWKIICTWGKLIKSMVICGAGLKSLHIHCTLLVDQNDGDADLIRELIHSLSFPILESLTITLELYSNCRVLTKLINSSPNLKTLVIINGHGNSTYEYNCQLVEILRGIQSLGRLLELKFDLGNGDCFEAMKHLVLTQLTHLHLHCSNNSSFELYCPRLSSIVDRAQHFTYFLKVNCPSLTSLDFYFQSSSSIASSSSSPSTVTRRAFSKNAFPRGIPQLIKLVHLGFHGGAYDSPCYIYVHKSALTSQKFPNLTSISTNLGVIIEAEGLWTYFDLPRRLEAGLEPGVIPNSNYLKFSQVTTLQLKLHHYTDIMWFAEDFLLRIEKNIRQFHVIFPNLRQVRVDNHFRAEYNGMECVHGNRGVSETLHCILAEIAGLESLEISNYYKDWLCWMSVGGDGKPLKACPENRPNKIVSNLKHLKLTSVDRKLLRRIPSANHPILNLTPLLHFLPNLQLLEIGVEFIGHNLSSSQLQEKLNVELKKVPVPGSWLKIKII